MLKAVSFGTNPRREERPEARGGNVGGYICEQWKNKDRKRRYNSLSTQTFEKEQPEKGRGNFFIKEREQRVESVSEVILIHCVVFHIFINPFP